MKLNQPVVVTATGEWGRVTATSVDPTGAELYRVEYVGGHEAWFLREDLRISSTLEAFNAPYFWTLAALGLLIILAILVSN